MGRRSEAFVVLLSLCTAGALFRAPNTESTNPLAEWFPLRQKVWLCETAIDHVYNFKMTPVGQAASQVLLGMAEKKVGFRNARRHLDAGPSPHLVSGCQAFGQMVQNAIGHRALELGNFRQHHLFCMVAVQGYPFYGGDQANLYLASQDASPKLAHPDDRWEKRLLARARVLRAKP